jgi:hypothetical protein
MNLAHSAAIRKAVSQSGRVQAARARVGLIVGALQRTGHGGLLAPPHFQDAAIRRALERLAHTANPATPEGRAILHANALTPGALLNWLRRHREQVHAMLSPRTNGPSSASHPSR